MKNQVKGSFLFLALAGMAGCSSSDSKNDSSFAAPTPKPVVISAAGQDQLQSAVAGPDGTFYAAGFAAESIGAKRQVVVVKLTAAGDLDKSFSEDGIVTTTLESQGGSDEIDIAVQTDGKIVVSSTIAAANAQDRDIGVIRLNSDGSVDTSFGTDGIARIDLNTGTDPGDGTAFKAPDASRGLAIDSENRIYVHGAARGQGTITGGNTARVDTDFVVARLTTAGALDTTWGTSGSGKHFLDIYASDTHSNATARGIAVFSDFSVVAGGYAAVKGLGDGPQPVVYKLTPAGVLDTTFATNGVFNDTVLTTQTEVYNFAVHGDHIVTAGYGRESGDANEWVSMRFGLADGKRDEAWGGATNGAVMVDPSGVGTSSNCRNAIALPGGKTMLLGSTGPSNKAEQDAAIAILDANGKLDSAYGVGIYKYALGSNGNDQFWGGAVSGNNAIAVGYKGGLAVADQTETQNDDSYIVILPVR